jgi:hypothetical protein
MTLIDLTASRYFRGPRRVLSVDETNDARESGTLPALIAAGAWPAMAGADDDDDGADGGDDGDGDGDGGDDGGDDGADDQHQARGGRQQRQQQRRQQQQADDDGDDDDGDDDSDTSEAKLRRQLNEERRERRRLERKQAKAEKAKAESEGEYQKLYEDEQKRSASLEQKLKTGARDRAITTMASSMSPEDIEVVTMLAQRELTVDDVVDEDGEVDEQAVEKALKAIKKRKPHLFKDPQRAQSGDAGRGDGGANGRRRRGRLTDNDEAFDPREHMRRGYANSTSES